MPMEAIITPMLVCRVEHGWNLVHGLVGRGCTLVAYKIVEYAEDL